MKTNNPKVIYENIAKWGKILNSETTSVFADEEVALIVAKFYGWKNSKPECNNLIKLNIF